MKLLKNLNIETRIIEKKDLQPGIIEIIVGYNP